MLDCPAPPLSTVSMSTATTSGMITMTTKDSKPGNHLLFICNRFASSFVVEKKTSDVRDNVYMKIFAQIFLFFVSS